MKKFNKGLIMLIVAVSIVFGSTTTAFAGGGPLYSAKYNQHETYSKYYENYALFSIDSVDKILAYYWNEDSDLTMEDALADIVISLRENGDDTAAEEILEAGDVLTAQKVARKCVGQYLVNILKHDIAQPETWYVKSFQKKLDGIKDTDKEFEDIVNMYIEYVLVIRPRG